MNEFTEEDLAILNDKSLDAEPIEDELAQLKPGFEERIRRAVSARLGEMESNFWIHEYDDGSLKLTRTSGEKRTVLRLSVEESETLRCRLVETPELVPARVSHPGKIIQKELDARGWTMPILAYKMNVSGRYLDDILKGTRGITSRDAVQLGIAFGTSALLWARMDADYRVWKERQKGEKR